MDTHPLALPEIVLRIGMYIQIWFPIPSEHTIHNNIAYTLEPDNLLAAIAVNSLFYRTLEPLLWTVYNEYDFHPGGFCNYPAHTMSIFLPNLNRSASPDFTSRIHTLNANCQHIRYLELLHPHIPPHLFQQPDLFQLHNCTRFRELKMSNHVDLGWAVQLVEANPNLPQLDRTYPDECE